MPHDLFSSVEHALGILNWQENLSSEEMPPEWMWSLDHELEPWFERVTEEREEKCGGGSDSRERSNGSGFMKNELTEGLR